MITTWPGTWRLAAAHWENGVAEMAGSVSRRIYASHVRPYLAQVTVSDMTPAPSGVRAQAVDRQGGLVDDFTLQHRARVLVVRNAPSPAATSSLANAEHILDVVNGKVHASVSVPFVHGWRRMFGGIRAQVVGGKGVFPGHSLAAQGL